MKALIALAVTALSLGAVSETGAAEPGKAMLPKFGLPVGNTFPLDGLVDQRGQAIPQQKLVNKHVLINFFSTDCAPCIWEVPTLNQVKERRLDLNVLAITPDSGELASKYLRKYGLTWQVAAGAETLVLKQLNIQSYPAFALLDAHGRLLATTPAYALGGPDGRATVAGIEAWVNTHASKPQK